MISSILFLLFLEKRRLLTSSLRNQVDQLVFRQNGFDQALALGKLLYLGVGQGGGSSGGICRSLPFSSPDTTDSSPAVLDFEPGAR